MIIVHLELCIGIVHVINGGCLVHGTQIPQTLGYLERYMLVLQVRQQPQAVHIVLQSQ